MSLYYTKRRTAFAGEMRDHTKEEVTYVVHRLGGKIDKHITDDTDNIVIGDFLSEEDLQILEMNYPHKVFISERELDKTIEDVEVADGIYHFHELALGAETPDIVGRIHDTKRRK